MAQAAQPNPVVADRHAYCGQRTGPAGDASSAAGSVGPDARGSDASAC